MPTTQRAGNCSRPVLTSGNFTLEPVHAADLIRMAELVARYHDLPLGSVDASVIALAERRGIAEIATLDPATSALSALSMQ
ncbi:MAG: PIN domain-containing protein [Solirubrobacteraceae bacterium]